MKGEINQADEKYWKNYFRKYPYIKTNEELSKMSNISVSGMKTKKVSILYEVKKGSQGLDQALNRVCAAVDKAIDDGYSFVILSDRGVNDKETAIPALLATAGVHHHLF